jgi:hypothetical protein
MVGVMEREVEKAVGYLRQAEALRQIAAEMQGYDKKAARNLIDLAEEYEGKAEQITLKSPQVAAT